MAARTMQEPSTGSTVGALIFYGGIALGAFALLVSSNHLVSSWGYFVVLIGWLFALFNNKRKTSQPAVAHGDSALEMFAPRWGIKAHQYIVDLPTHVRPVYGVFLVILLFFVIALAFGGGYTSIQGVRIPIAALIEPWYSINADSFPSFPWWLIPLGTTFVQVVAKTILKPVWIIAVWFDGATTAIFVTIALTASLAASPINLGLAQTAVVAAHIGLIVAVIVEQLLLTILLSLRAVMRGY